MNLYHLDIITPFGSYFSQEVESIKFSNDEFVLMILANHTPIVSKVAICELVVKTNKNTFHYAISGGVVNVKKDHTVTLMVNAIERSDEIDVNRAKEAKQRAQNRLDSKEAIDKDRAILALKRAETRLLVSLKK